MLRLQEPSERPVSEAKKEATLAPPLPSSPSSVPKSSSFRSDASDFSPDDSLSLSPSLSPSPSSSMKGRDAVRKKAAKVSFLGDAASKDPPIPPKKDKEEVAQIAEVAKVEAEFHYATEPQPPELKQESTGERRKSFRERLQGGLFWSGIRSRISTATATATAASVDLGKMVNRLGPGAAFGAKTLLKKEARTASVMTVEPTKLLVVTREDYVGLLGSMEEARAREAAEFLCRYVLMVEMRGGRASDNLHPALRHSMARTSKSMTCHTLDRGTVLLTHGTESSDTIHILRKGALAYCYPLARQGNPGKWHRSKVASMNPSQVVSTPGEMVGASHALLGWKEPATVRVESATCEVYRVPWLELQRVLTNRILTLMREKLQHCHGLRSQVAAQQDPKGMLYATASSKLEGATPSKEQQAVKDALENAFDTACSFAGVAGVAGRPSRHAEKEDDSCDSKENEERDRKTSKDRKEADVEDQFLAKLASAITQLEDATKKADLWESLATGEAPFSTTSSQPPPITSAAVVRAHFFKTLKEDPGLLRMEHFMAQAALDPDKAHLNAWMKRYITKDHLRKHSELQGLQLLLWRQLKNPELMREAVSHKKAEDTKGVEKVRVKQEFLQLKLFGRCGCQMTSISIHESHE